MRKVGGHFPDTFWGGTIYVMGIFNKLFGKKDIEKLIIQRAPRIQLTALHDIKLLRSDPPAEGPIGIANLSISGIGLLKKEAPSWPAPQSIIKGDLTLDSAKEKIPLEMLTVHISEQIVGCAFLDPGNSLLRKTILRYFEAELAALTMTRVPDAMLQQDESGQPSWYHGENNCELYLTSNSQGISHFNLCFFGNYFEGGQGQKTRFGHVIEDSFIDKPKYKGSSLIDWKTQPQEDLLATARKLVKNIPELPGDHAELISKALGNMQ